MALKKLYVGSSGPFLYDDADPVEDPDEDFAGESQKALLSNGAIGVTVEPSADTDVVRLGDISTGIGNNVRTLTADLSLDPAEYVLLCDTSVGSITLTLPPAAACSGSEFIVIKVTSDANTVTLVPDGTETINGASSYVVSNHFEVVYIVSAGISSSGWDIISSTKHEFNNANPHGVTSAQLVTGTPQSGTYTFGGGASGDVASMTFEDGILIGVTLVP